MPLPLPLPLPLPFAVHHALRPARSPTAKARPRALRVLSGQLRLLSGPLLLGISLALAGCVGDDEVGSASEATTDATASTGTSGSTEASDSTTTGDATGSTEGSGSASNSDSSTGDPTSTSGSTGGESTGETTGESTGETTGETSTGSTTGGGGPLWEACVASCTLFGECDAEDFPGVNLCTDQCIVSWGSDDGACEDARVAYLSCIGAGTCEDLESDGFCDAEYGAIVGACEGP